MTYDELAKLIAADESRCLELKKSTGELSAGMHSACAFLNTDGGWLIFGIAPTSLKILGQDVTDNTQRELAQALSGLEPSIKVDIEYIDVPETNGHKVIAIHFDGWVWGMQPYTYHGVPYLKVESTTKQMSRTMFEDRLRAARPRFYAWDAMQAEAKSISDIDEGRVRGAIRLGVEHGRMNAMALTEPFDVLLGKLELLTDGQPNNAAVALFGKTTAGYPQLRMRMARFVGTDKNEFRDNQQVTGNFFELLDAGMAFFLKHLNMSGKIVGLYRDEHLEVPAEALRESLVNALCHRQYEKYNLTVGIAIYDDRIEISNPGIFPPSITPETIKQPHESYPYNLIMAQVLYKTSLLESWGSGASRIMDACKALNVPEPAWSINGGFIVVTFKRPSYDDVAQNVAQNNGNVAQPKFDPSNPSNDPSSTQVRPKFDPSSANVKKIIEVCSEEYMSSIEMMAAVGIMERKNFRKSYLNPAINANVVESLYPDTPRHPQQRYRLTEQALAWKRAHQQ